MSGGTFGVPAPTYTNWEFTGLNFLNQEAMLATMPANGRVVSITARMGGNGQTVGTIFCLWDGAAGGLLAQSAAFTAAIGNAGVGTQTLYTQTLLTPYLALAGTSLYLGWYR